MIESILQQALIALPLILGAYLILSLMKLPDLSLESAYLFGAVSAFLAKDLPFPCILISAMCGAAIVGLCVSLLNQVLKIPFLLGAIITNGLFHGIIQYLLGQGFISFTITTSLNTTLYLSMIALAVVGVLFFLLRSQLGYCFAIQGNNPSFFKHHLMAGRYIVILGVALGHALAGLSGFLFAQAGGFIDITMGFGIILMCLTALMLGKLLIKTHVPNILVPIMGIVAYFLLQQLLLRMGLNLKYFNAFQGLCILASLLVAKKNHRLSLDHLGV